MAWRLVWFMNNRWVRSTPSNAKALTTMASFNDWRISEAAIMLRPRIREAGLTLETELPDQMPQLRADRITQLAVILGRQALLEEPHQRVKLAPRSVEEAREAANQIDDLRLDERHQDEENQGDGEHDRDLRRKGGSASGY